ncbi:MAG: amino acid adenylation domain-containing protein [Pseudomonadota bacterium]
MNSFLQFLQTCRDRAIQFSLEHDQVKVHAPKDTLNAELVAQLRQYKPEILEWLRNNASGVPSDAPLQATARERDQAVPASQGQEALWLTHQVYSMGDAYHFVRVLTLTGTLRLDLLERAFSTIVQRHEALRTVFVQEDGVLLQKSLPARAIEVSCTDLAALDQADREREAAALQQRAGHASFDLERDLMLRVQVIRLSEQEHQLLIVMHHIASDGWSLGVLVAEFQALYTSLADDKPAELAPLPLQYADYAIWTRSAPQQDQQQRDLNYWTAQLAAAPEVHNIPTDRARAQTQSFCAGTIHTAIDASTLGAFKQLAQAQGATLFMALETLFAILIARYSQNDDIVIGTPVAGRDQEALAGLIGYFVNMLPLRHQHDQTLSFNALLPKAKQDIVAAFEHQNVPFEAVLRALAAPRSTSYSPLIQIAFTLQNNDVADLALPGLTCSIAQSAKSYVPFEITLSATESTSGLSLEWAYASELFEQSTMVRMAAQFERLMRSVVAAPDLAMRRHDIVAAAERAQLLDWSAERANYPAQHCLHELFEQQAARHPHAIALVYEQEQLSYAELNHKANQLAHYLLTHKRAAPDSLVGLCVERSVDMLVGILGILKAGGAYVPLDPTLPQARLAYMLEDADLATVITHRELQSKHGIGGAQALCLDDPATQAQLAAQPGTDIPVADTGLTPANLAYVIYTSGSTGKPKGALLEHRNVTRLFAATDANFGFGPADTWTMFHSYGFDFSVWEIWGALCYGGKLVIVPYLVSRTPELFHALLVEQRVTVLNQTPSAFMQLIAANAAAAPSAQLNLKYVIFGGEALNEAALQPWFAKHGQNAPQLINMYGITETTVHVTYQRVLADQAQGVNAIGRPIPDLGAYVLDAALKLAPIGVAGELHISGAGLARGYLNRPELTAERFIDHPYAKRAGARLYKSGDLARYLPDGSIAYLGRIDSQVKIRGFRIELGEIESALTSHPQVKESLVLATESVSGDKRLVAYVIGQGVPETGTFDADAILIAALRQHLAQTLPDYMIPAAFVVLDQMPLTPNGKVDHKALPAPDMAQSQSEYVAPRTATESRLCALWQEVLDIERVGITDNFFQLGGHSLSATRLVAKINQAFDIVLPLKTLFVAQTLEALAQAVAQIEAGTGRAPLLRIGRGQALLPSFSQQRLWLLDQIDGGSAHYNMPGALKLDGVLDQGALARAFATILERHESLRTCFQAGDDGQVFQVIQAAQAVSIAVPLTDLSQLPDGEQRVHLLERITEEAGRAFDLGRDLMLRGQLLKLAADQHILLVTMHHIASDGWSMAILINEFSALYSAYVQGQGNPLPALEIQYADYAHWQRNWLQGEVLEQQLGYWTGQLANLPVVHSLPLDHARPPMQTFNGASISTRIDAATVAALKTLCQEAGATLFMGLHAAFSVLLARYSNETDIVVGSPIANREQAEVAGLIGFFVNTLVLRSDLSGAPSFAQLLAQSKATLLDAYAHQQVPFEQIVERLQPQRSMGHSALFQILLVLQNNEDGTLNLPGLTLSPVEMLTTIAQYELTLDVLESEQGLALSWSYNTDLFERSTIERMAAHFARLLAALLKAPHDNVFGHDIVDAQERRQLLLDWNATQAPYPQTLCMHELFEEQAARTPDALALRCDGQQLSYAQLNAQANQLARHLLAQRALKPDTLVGVCLERSLDMVVAILAILKAGAAYVPLDPHYPAARLAYMLADAKLDTVITHSKVQGSTPISPEQALCLDAPEVQQQLAAQASANLPAASTGLAPHHLAYIIYTSGSTGNPKGVMIEHRNAVAFLAWARTVFSAAQLARVLAATSMCFDLSVFEMFAPLCVGGASVIVKNILALGSDDTGDISLINTVPSAIEAVLASGQIPASVKTVNLAGEALKQSIVDRLYASGIDAVYDLYGPSEDTTYSTYVLRERQGRSSIGRPIHNSQMYVLNPERQLAPRGVAGELHIGGAGLARGYLDRPDLTAEKFIPNPYAAQCADGAGATIYKTGDLVRYLPDGKLEYLGRIDHQVKVRGFRIELGEIENALASHALVEDAVVLAKEAPSGDKRLVAYVVNAPAAAPPMATPDMTAALGRHLGLTLPEYMVPAAFVYLDQLPRTPNGKLDRKALPEPDFAQQQNVYVAPRTPTEKIVCDIWQDVLGLPQVGSSDNFFQLGGHSLLVMQVISRLQGLGLSASAAQVFGAKTAAELALAISAAADAALPLFVTPANLIPQDCAHITPAMLPLVALSAQEIERIAAQVPGGSANIQDIYPLAPMQENVLFLHMMSEKTDSSIVPSLFKINGQRQLDVFLEALQFLIDRHDILRTAVLWQGLSVPVQVVCRHARLPLTRHAFDTEQASLDHMQQLCTAIEQWMPLSGAPLLKLAIGQDKQSENFYVFLQLHHIIMDNEVLSLVIGEMAAFCEGKVALLPAPAPFREFIAHAQHMAPQRDAQAFFHAMLSDIEETTAPFGLLDIQGEGSRIVQARQTVPAPVAQAIRRVAKERGLSPATLFHAAWALVLSACSGRDSVVFGTLMSGRLQGTERAASVLGPLINILPMRMDLDALRVAELVEKTHAALIALLPFEHASLALAQRCSALPDGAPLFTAMLNYRHSNPVEGQSLIPNMEIELLMGLGRTNYPLHFAIDDIGDGFSFDIQIDQSIDPQRMLAYMQTAIARLVALLEQAPDTPVATISILPDAERHQVLEQWNDTKTDFPQERCIHELFERRLESNPDAIALVCQDRQLSYAELNRRANQLAHFLVHEKQVQVDSLVGLCVERSVEMLVGMLGILKAGAAYIPLDPAYPCERLQTMLEDAAPTVLLTQQHLVAGLPATGAAIIALDGQWEPIAAHAQENLARRAGMTPHRLAYVIYTSGSTGKPKAAGVHHIGVSNLLHWYFHAIGVDAKARALVVTSFSFDLTQKNLLSGALGGGQVHLSQEPFDPDNIIAEIKQHQITLLNLTPSAFYAIIDADSGNDLSSLRHAVLGGEPISIARIGKLAKAYPQLRIINSYGPTECSDVVAYHVLQGDWAAQEYTTIPLGRPTPNTRIYILDSKRRPVPQGIVGEIYIGGIGVGRGYLKRPELTDQSFTADPFNAGGRMYRTGDVGRQMADGTLEYLGRNDHQVKIRGFRIELGEIENALSTHGQVKDTIVVARESAPGDKRLVAYVVGEGIAFDAARENEAKAEFIAALRTHLGRTLPDYMVPGYFVVMDALPLSPNGKVDRKALPAPDMSQSQAAYQAPRTHTEQLLCALWQEILGVERIGLQDNFFQLGGHSLLATRLLARINQSFQVALPLPTIFNTRSLEELAQAIARLEVEGEKAPLIQVARDLPLVPSYAQQRLWLLDQIDGGSAHYNLPGALRLTGSLDMDALNRAFSTIVERHESLRTRFGVDQDGQLHQVIAPATPLCAPLTELSHLASGEQHMQVLELMAEEASKVFDLSADLMLRAQLLRLTPEQHLLLVTMHHIASDGWSMGIVINEFSALYAAYAQGQDNPLPALEIQYADYAHWQRNWLQGEVLEKQLDYWKTQLAQLPTVHNLPLDHHRPAQQGFAGATVKTRVDAPVLAALNTLCRNNGATLFMGLHAAFSVLLSRYSNETDIVMGSPIANREQAEVAGLVGFFVNTLVLRSDLSGAPSFTELLNRSRQMLLDAYSHQQVPFEQIVEQVQPQRSLSHSPLFQVMLALQNNEEGSLALPGLTLDAVERNSSFAQFDLTLNISETADSLLLEWEYNTELFEADTISRITQHFATLLADMVRQPSHNVFQSAMLSVPELQQLAAWNATAAPYPREICVHELFEQQVKAHPGATALVFEGQQLSYAELNARANQLAHYLIAERQVMPDTLVGICIERSLDMIVAILGILKAGAAYLPLDPEYPASRLAYMIDDGRLSTVITQTHLLGKTSVNQAQALCIDAAAVMAQLQAQASSDIAPQQRGLNARHLAYVIYTSGSTGNPKGVMIAHANLVNLVCAVQQRYRLANTDGVLQFSTINFDMSAEDIFGALCSGSRLILRSDAWPLTPQAFWQACEHANATVLDLPTAYWHELANDIDAAIPHCVRHISIGGEQVNGAMISAWRQKPRAAEIGLLNVYGPTECTIDATFADIVDSDCGIGKALPNVSLYVLNQQLGFCPLGVGGELHIGGAGLARGYLHRPELTAEKFIDNPYHDPSDPASSERLYKTGDLVHWRADGVLDYLGRIDDQVKIRGFRIELGEIENALAAHPSVSDTVLLAKQTANGDKQLVAYVVLSGVHSGAHGSEHAASGDANTNDWIDTLRQHLGLSLPDHMIPAAFVRLDQLPLMANGKVDRKALPDPDFASQQRAYVAPSTDTERILCDIWQELIGVEQVGVTDNFFHLGGHSLLAMRLVTQLNKTFKVTLPLKALFQCVDLGEMAGVIEQISALEKNKTLKQETENKMEIEW